MLSLSNVHLSTAVLLKPIFLHGLSGFLHLLLLVAVVLSWVWRKFTAGPGDESKKKPNNSLFKTTVFSSLALSAFNFLLCFINYFYWYTSGWSEEKLVTLLDLALKTLAWGVVCVCLQKGFFSSGQRRFSFFFRAWFTFYLFVSCYCIVVDIVVMSGRRVSLPTQYLVSDAVSTCVGFFFCYVGYFVKNEVHVDNDIQEPLLNADSLESKETKGGDTVTPFSNAGILSILTFSWVGPLIAVGNKKTLDLEDVPQLDSRDSVIGAFPTFREKVEADCGGINSVTTLKLVKSLIISAWKEILITAFLVLLNTLASYVGPYLIDGFVQYLDGQRLYENQGYFLVSAFFFAKLVECLTRRHWFFRLQQVGLRIRALLVTMIYNKALTLSCQSKQGHTSGEIINFMTVDAERVGVFSWYMHDLWMVVLQVTLALLILYKNLGLASIAAFVATVIIMLANVPLGSLQEKFQKKLMESKDTRMKATSEILRNMRILKLQGWEMKFLSKITELRKNEQGWLKKNVYTGAVTAFVFWGSPTFVSVVTFGTCMLMGIPLESGKILSALATFQILQRPIYRLPDTISTIAQTKVSLDRIVSFLRLDDLQSDVVEKLPWGSSDTAIEVVGGNFSWDLSSPNPTLQNINLKVFNGMRVAVCGTVGSGKSTLLSCVLGEVPRISGILKICGTKAYVAQSPWIQSGKIEDNILFGERMDRERYEKVLEACSLKKDLEILSFGDQTIIGERGINLSGGQKQRIQIARALYQDADIYLFDDPFSAVDAHTGSHLFKECLLGLLCSKTVVYVTHQVEFLPAADLILVMKDGKITQCGKYADLLNSGADFMELVGAHKKALSALDSLDGATVYNEISVLEQDVNVSDTHGFKEKEASKDEQNGQTDNKSELQGQLVQEEEREKGKVGFSVYWKCITTAYGGALVPFILLAQILFQALQIGSNYWMAWATPISADVEPHVEGTTLIVVYVGLAIGSSFCVLARESLLATAGYKTATILFNKMNFCIFRAPMSFFDSTPSGRILNRASTDQSALDTNIPYQIASFAFIMVQLLGIIAVMSQVAWQVFVVFIPVVAVSIWYQQYYIASARELSRLVAVCKAPIIQHFAETISGTSTIRSFDQKSRFQETNMKLTDGYSRPKFNIAGAMEWLCFRLDMLSSITFAFSLIFLISIPQGFIDPGLAGLAVTYGLNLNMVQAWMIWNLCNMENKIISVERILQYTCIPCEPPLVVDENRPDSSWPSYGEVDIQDLQELLKRGIILAATVCGLLVFGCSRVFAVEGVVNAGYGVFGQSILLLRNTWPKVLQVLRIFKEQGLVLAVLLGLSAFFSMAETSITTLWPWKVRELAEKESENGVFRLLRSDVTRFLTTILIGTTVVNIGATALVTEAATAMFGEAGVSAATGVMTVAILLLTEITPKSIAVHNATEVARFVVRPVAWLSLVLYPVGRIVTYLSMGMLKLLGLKGRSEPYVTEDELKLMLRGAELSGAIEEEEQDMIENVLEIKDTHVREVMTPLVDVVAIDASSSLVDFHHLWVTHQYSRVPVFEQRVDNIMGIAYAMDLLDYVQKGELLESTTVGDMAHKPAYFVPDSMSVWNLLREFRIRKVHMAVVLNEYGGTVGIVTLEDVVEEIVGEIFDENDSKEEIQKKTGYIVMRAEGVFDVDANTSIDQLSEDLNIKMPEGHQYETVSGFVCEAFGYIPRTGECIKVVLEREDEDDNNESNADQQDQKEKNQIFKLEILAGNARKVSAVRFERINNNDEMLETKVTRMVPKIMKRKWSSDENSDNDAEYDGDTFAKRPQDDIPSEYLVDQENSNRG